MKCLYFVLEKHTVSRGKVSLFLEFALKYFGKKRQYGKMFIIATDAENSGVSYPIISIFMSLKIYIIKNKNIYNIKFIAI